MATICAALPQTAMTRPRWRVRRSRRGAAALAAAAAAAAGLGAAAPAPKFALLPVAGDGRCLFRSVAAARALLAGGGRSDERTERATADELRGRAVAELAGRREELSWAVEHEASSFEDYLARMSSPSAWGGEIEMLCLSHALQEPIAVYMPATSTAHHNGALVHGGQEMPLSRIALYGEDYAPGECEPTSVASLLFDGVGHYQGLTPLPGDSKL